MSDTGIVFIGAGRTGTILCRMVADAGFTVNGIASRNPESSKKAAALAGVPDFGSQLSHAAARADALFLTVPDAEIRTVVPRLCTTVKKNAIVMHCSGALSSDVLADFRKNGASVGSLHPLRSFASPDCDLDDRQKIFFYFEGDSTAETFSRRLTHDLKAEFYRIRTEDKPMYHAAAVISSNFLVALQHYALSCMESAGIQREQGLASLLPLIQSTVDNMASSGVPDAMTGPVERGDTDTLLRHLTAMKRSGFPNELYICAAREAVAVAMDKHAPGASKSAEILELLASFSAHR